MHEHPGEDTGVVSCTVPDQSITIRQMVQRLSAGYRLEELPISKRTENSFMHTDDEDHPLAGVDMRKCDPAEIQAIQMYIKERLEKSVAAAQAETEEALKQKRKEHIDKYVSQEVQKKLAQERKKEQNNSSAE